MASESEPTHQASSIKSSYSGSSVHSLAESISSFYSAVTGSGTRVPKRRRADFSRLGVPEWYSEDPPPAASMPGTAPPSEMPPFTAAHATVMDEGVKPWLGLVLYSHAPPTAGVPMYHNGAKIVGEVRMKLEKAAGISSIDVWFTLHSDTVIDTLKPTILTMTACVWSRKQGDPRVAEAGGETFKGKFPAGTFVFPFEFPALPPDTLVTHPDEERRKNKARVPLPPSYSLTVLGGFSGNIKYTVGVNVTREGFGSVNEEFGMDVQYLPLSRAMPRVKTPTPYLPTREDWPFAREVVGGWTLTPFGGRGRLGEEDVELEGILGIQVPAVYTAGQTLEFSLTLWSSHPLALETLAQPGAISVGYYKSDIFALDALNPRNSARNNRMLERLAEGRVWLTDVGRLADREEKLGVDDDATLAGDATEDTKEDGGKEAPPPSPTPWFQGILDTERVVRLGGEVRVPACSHPSFRYTSMAREYILHVLIQHPQFKHISPCGTGVVAEVPVWYVLNRFGHLTAAEMQAQQTETERAALPVKGHDLAVGEDAVRLPEKVGHVTTLKRPTWHAQRVAAF